MVFETLIGWLAPSQCLGCSSEGSALCELCSTSEILPFGEKCWSCGKLSIRSKTCQNCKRRGSPNFVWITTDYENLARKLLRAYKFGHNRSAAGPVAKLMIQSLISFNSDEHIQQKNYLVACVPTATTRVRERGFDHSALLARKIATKMNFEYESLLQRHGQARQTGAKRAQRLNQLKNSFSVRPKANIKNRNILLIDDVITTGATISEVAKTLRQAGAKSVDALIFAKRL